MTIRCKDLLSSSAAAGLTLSMAGCQQLQGVFATRPSEIMPAYKPVDVQYATQNWSPGQREWFYHAARGAELMPYEWFLALEQPEPNHALARRVSKFVAGVGIAGMWIGGLIGAELKRAVDLHRAAADVLGIELAAASEEDFVALAGRKSSARKNAGPSSNISRRCNCRFAAMGAFAFV